MRGRKKAKQAGGLKEHVMRHKKGRKKSSRRGRKHGRK
jgi:hypothetical protein